MPAAQLARQILPTPETLQATPGLRWLGRYLNKRPWLWVANRRRVAMGAALGLGLGVIPIPSQMVIAGAAAVLLRANVGAAVAATWLTNPLTLVPIWSLAIFLGNAVLPGAQPLSEISMLELSWQAPATWWPAFWHWVTSLGPSLLVGLPLAGLLLGVSLYAAVYVAWGWVIRLERRRRLRRRKQHI